MKPYALITGASKGLGKALAIELAKQRHNLLLVSLPEEELGGLCSKIQQEFKVDAQTYETDFTRNDAVYELAKWANKKYDVDILINNVGIGGTASFQNTSTQFIDRIIQLNIRVPSILTRLILPNLERQSKAYVLNVASMASFSPIAYKTIYPASKAFIWSFSRGLYQELRDSNVFVSVIHPGPMKTNPEVTRRIISQGKLGRMGLVSTDEIAKIAIRQIYKRDSLIIPGFMNKLNWLLMKIVPIWIRLPIVSNIIKREITVSV